MLRKKGRSLKVHGSEEAGENSMENTGEEVSLGKTGEHMRCEGKRSR